MREAASLQQQLDRERASRSSERLQLQQRILILQEVLKANRPPTTPPALEHRKVVVDAVGAYLAVQRSRQAINEHVARVRGQHVRPVAKA
jgi:hypothetical protein